MVTRSLGDVDPSRPLTPSTAGAGRIEVAEQAPSTPVALGHLTHSRQRPAPTDSTTGERATDPQETRMSIDATLGWSPGDPDPEIRPHVWHVDDPGRRHTHAAIHWSIVGGEVGLSGPVDSVRRVLVAALAALDHDIAAKRIPVEAAT